MVESKASCFCYYYYYYYYYYYHHHHHYHLGMWSRDRDGLEEHQHLISGGLGLVPGFNVLCPSLPC